MDFENSKTRENLQKAFAGESMARNKYSYYASKAKKEGYVQIAEILEETANQEKEHAKLWFKLLNGGVIGDTLNNLKDASAGEHYEWTDMYDRFAKEAKDEGFSEISFLFSEVAKIEKNHQERFDKLIQNLSTNTVFKREQKVVWQCKNCGFIHEGNEAPKICPVCKHPIDYFALKIENY